MNEPLWIVLAVVTMAAVVWLLGRAAHARVAESVRCPEKKTAFTVDFDRRLDAWWGPGRKVDVLRCTAFADPELPTCAKECLRLPSRGATGGALATPAGETPA